MGMLEVTSYLVTAQEMEVLVVLKSWTSHFPGTGCDGKMGGGADSCEQTPLGHFGTSDFEVRFCAESGKASKQIKKYSIL
jgi:hypothetical protein